jgi:hypothetical protein
VNSWVPFFFDIQTIDDVQFCEINTELKHVYYLLTNIYISVIVIAPTAFIMMSNLLIIIRTKRAAKDRVRTQINKEKTKPRVLSLENKNLRSNSVRKLSVSNVENKDVGTNSNQKTSCIVGIKQKNQTLSSSKAADLNNSVYGLEIEIESKLDNSSIFVEYFRFLRQLYV